MHVSKEGRQHKPGYLPIGTDVVNAPTIRAYGES